ncbi:anthrone oxygenase family protein [Streptomyces sp. HUAS MG47]|uniref:anthrone oxygenase family protein n=1 Tax=Streptomyces solicamelliae TaxID=3231716 RepID=UPI003877FC98
MPTLLLALAVGCTGLYAGFMVIFQTGIMPALARLTDAEFVHAMRRINEYVPKPLFLVVFLGIVGFPVAAFFVPIDDRTDTQKWLILAGLVCVLLNHLVTIAGNIPLNNALAASEGGAGDDPAAVRAAFERRWNGFHRIRTPLVTAGFGLLIAASLT